MAKGKVTFRIDRCKGCGLCVNACPKNILELDLNTINKKGHQPARIVRPDECIGCMACALMCPDQVITVERE